MVSVACILRLVDILIRLPVSIGTARAYVNLMNKGSCSREG